MKHLHDRTHAVLLGASIGDAIGGSTEGYSPQQIQERFGGRVTDIVGPFFENWKTRRPISPYHKGDGNVTDDTLMIQALIRVYEKHRSHLDAYSMSEEIVRIMQEEVRYIPETERMDVISNRVFLAEKWLPLRVKSANIDPRDAGVGNVVNCGATMYMAPVGIVNAGNPRAAYAEAIDITGSHQSSYGRESAGLHAAAIAAAMLPGATAHDVAQTVLNLAHDGTRNAVSSVIAAVENIPHGASDNEISALLRDAIRPFDTVGETYREPLLDARIPSRTKAIEEFPIALGFVLAYPNSISEPILGAVNYGRDSDSIAGMAGSIAGALHGMKHINSQWVQRISQASRIDFDAYANSLASIAEEIIRQDVTEHHHAIERSTAMLNTKTVNASSQARKP